MSIKSQGFAVYPAATLTAAPTAVDQANSGWRGCVLVVDVTVVGTAPVPSINVILQGKDPASGKYYPIAETTSLNAVGTYVLRVYPGLVPTPGIAVSDVLPPTYRVLVTHANAGSITYSVGLIGMI